MLSWQECISFHPPSPTHPAEAALRAFLLELLRARPRKTGVHCLDLLAALPPSQALSPKPGSRWGVDSDRVAMGFPQPSRVRSASIVTVRIHSSSGSMVRWRARLWGSLQSFPGRARRGQRKIRTTSATTRYQRHSLGSQPAQTEPCGQAPRRGKTPTSRQAPRTRRIPQTRKCHSRPAQAPPQAAAAAATSARTVEPKRHVSHGFPRCNQPKFDSSSRPSGQGSGVPSRSR